MDLVVNMCTREAEDVRGLELRAVDGSALPAFSAGAHLDLHLPGGLCRQYSLTNDPQETHRYCLGVGLSPSSRGGSRFVHERLAVGDIVRVDGPRALFGIEPSAAEHVFIAGGIGVTPIISMIRWCVSNQRAWRLLYCVRLRSRAAYLWTLAPHLQRVQLHVDDDSDGRFPDLAGYLASVPPQAHVYCCGPAPLMDAVGAAAAAAGMPPSAAHFERFSADATQAAQRNNDHAFTVVLSQQGRQFTVTPCVSILQTLEEHGIAMPFGCRQGLCGSCEVPLLHGQADHRDHVLS